MFLLLADTCPTGERCPPGLGLMLPDVMAVAWMVSASSLVCGGALLGPLARLAR